MNYKKFISASLATIMLFTVIAACDTAEPEDENNTTTSITTTDDQTETGDGTTVPDDTEPEEGTQNGGEKVNGIMYPEGLPIVDEGTYTFSLFVDDSQEDHNYVMLDILEEQTNVQVDLIVYPYTIATERLNLSLNTGDYPDAIGGWTLSANDILRYGVDEGVYIAIDQYIEDYAPRLTELLELEGVRDAMTTPDGHIYTIPYVTNAPYVAFNPYINTRWLENVGMEMPATTDEFTEVLRAFRDQDANDNGNPDDEIPFTTGPDNKYLTQLTGWFGKSLDANGFTMVGSELQFAADSDEFKEAIKYLASLNEEGLIDQELFTQDSSQWKAKGAQDIYGVSIMYGSGDIMPYEANTEPDWAPLPVLSAPGVDNPNWLRNTYGNDVLKNQVVITDNAEHPEVIVRWWDNLMMLDNSVQSQRGPLGVTIEKEEDGSFTALDTSDFSEEEQARYDWGHLWPQALPKYVPDDVVFNETEVMYDEKAVVDELYEPYLTERIPTYWIKAEDAADMSDISTAISDYIATSMAQWISGQGDVEADWDSYLDQLDRLGVDRLIEMRQNALN